MKVKESQLKLDKRLLRRHKQMKESMLEKNTAVINQICNNRSDMVSLCRFINNNNVPLDYLTKEETSKANALSLNKHVLVVNDTTEINYQAHANFLSKDDTDLGPTGNNKDIGFFLHPGLVIDTTNGLGIGFSYLHIWNRRWDKQDKYQRKYETQPIAQKESYRWIECGLMSKAALSSAQTITIVADRESDIYEEFAIVPDPQTHLLIRSRQNRNLMEGDNLYERLANTKVTQSYELKVRTTKNRTGRNTTIEVKYSKIRIKKPVKQSISESIPDYVEMQVVEAKEVHSQVPKGEKPVHWILLTTHEINNINDAIQIITWYAMRWQIELLFNTLKTAALDIESSELETGKALKKLCVVALGVALKINQLRQTRTDTTAIPATMAFTNEQLAFIKILIPKYEGKTEKQKNHYKENSIAWAGWIIARLGGWKGYVSESPPGNKTYKWGLDRFNAIFEGFNIAKILCA